MSPKFRINRITGLEIVWGGGPKLYTDTHTDTHTHTHTHTQTHRHTHRHTHTHTHRGLFYKSCFSAKMQKQD